MHIIPAEIPDIKIIEPVVYRDRRGFFLESYNRGTFAAVGIASEFVQDNLSHSARNVLRGLHYQIRRPQGKLVRVLAGEVLDITVDLRRSSPWLGRWVSVVLSEENMRAVWIPVGFAHGFLVRSASAQILYKTTDYYAPEHERAILWRDPDIGINWQNSEEPVLSEKDRSAGSFAEADLFE